MLEAPRRLGEKPAGDRKGNIPHEVHDVVHQDGRYRAEEAATTNMDTVTRLETVNQEQHNLPGDPAGQCGVTLSNHLGVPSLPYASPSDRSTAKDRDPQSVILNVPDWAPGFPKPWRI